jgi:polysaccharide export outer membrane protein
MSTRKTVSTALVAFLTVSLIAPAIPAQQQGVEYTIGAGDLVRISVWRHADLDRDVNVNSNGAITFPPVGEINAAGLTPSALSREIVLRLRDYTRETTQVTVSVERFNSRAVFLTGQVMSPGRYSFEAIPDILQLMSMAGGPLPGADLSSVSIMRPSMGGPEIINVDLGAYMRGQRSTPLPQLMPGDTIEVPSIISSGGLAGPGMVYIFGEVNTPGAFPVSERVDLLQLIALAGGTTIDARIDRVSVVMDGGETQAAARVDLQRVVERGTADPFYLRPGDRVVVPSMQNELGGRLWTAAGAILTAGTQVLTAYLVYLTIGREIDDREARAAVRAQAAQTNP